MNKENQIQQIAEKAIKDILAVRDAREEKEYRAGEWVPKYDGKYWLVDSDGDIVLIRYTGNRYDLNRIKKGKVYPTEAIAEAAKAHADWWREFDMIADEQSKFTNDKGKIGARAGTHSRCQYVTYTPPEIGLSEPIIERLGGEQKVIDMLTRGRVFRFKWGGE